MKFLRKIFFRIIILLLLIALVLGIIGYKHYSSKISEKNLSTRVEEIISNDNFVKYDDMTENYKNAVIATEDHRFFEHGPVDFIAIGRAIFTNVKNKELQEGGSTITQQVAKNVVFDQEQTWIRKIAEIFAAFDLEKNYSKQEIFELYVNTAYFGDGYYGIYDASHGYYKKAPSDIDLNEASMLAGIPNAPSVYSPSVNPDLARKRQVHVLNKMIEYGYINEEEAKEI